MTNNQQVQYLKEPIPMNSVEELPIKIHITDASKMDVKAQFELGTEKGMVVQEIYMNSPVRVVNVLVKDGIFSEYLLKRRPMGVNGEQKSNNI